MSQTGRKKCVTRARMAKEVRVDVEWGKVYSKTHLLLSSSSEEDDPAVKQVDEEGR